MHSVPLFKPDTYSIAVAMACHYGGICFSIDAAVRDVLINGTSPVSMIARELYDDATAKFNQKDSQEAGKEETYGIFCIHYTVFMG